ncbi:MAG: Rrf2 family transcriptional regulator [Candidatus Magasanikbacteria bacterium]|jgi:Rrf2 family protein
MLTIRRETDYALQMLKVLGKSKNKIMSLNEISKKTTVSFLFLQKIARKLRLGKIIEAHQGVDGGYQLVVDPKKVTLRKVVEAMEGQCFILSCLDASKKIECCNPAKNCELKAKMGKLNKKIVKILDDVKLSDI